MNDQSPMPFGKHKGKTMEEVPASYLLWLWDESVWAQPERDIHAYIKESMSALLKEAPNHILEHKP